jgi:hypothetical protein
MSHSIHRVVGFESVALYTLRVQFEAGAEQVIDFGPMFEGGDLRPRSSTRSSLNRWRA